MAVVIPPATAVRIAIANQPDLKLTVPLARPRRDQQPLPPPSSSSGRNPISSRPGPLPFKFGPTSTASPLRHNLERVILIERPGGYSRQEPSRKAVTEASDFSQIFDGALKIGVSRPLDIISLVLYKL